MIRIGNLRREAGLLLRLCKIRVSLLASAACLAGFILGAPRLTSRVFMPVGGFVLLACGAGALNQYQEREIDARMERTMRRPIPRREISPRAALGAALALVGVGLVVLASADLFAAVLGALAVVWYNGLYTALKKRSPFAAVPGALTGAIPPAIGWVSGGGSLLDPRLGMLCVLLFMWQVPHFWLVLTERGPEYERARLPSLGDVFSPTQFKRIIAVWVVATAACLLVMSLAGPPGNIPQRAALLGLASWLSYEAVRFSRRPPGSRSRLFRTLNIFLGCVLVVLCAARLTGLREDLEAGGSSLRPRPH